MKLLSIEGFKEASEEHARTLIIVAIVSSWMIFPLMLKQFNPEAFGFVFILIVGAAFVFNAAGRKGVAKLPFGINLIVVSWLVYLTMLAFASVASSSLYSVKQWFILFGKFVFLFFLMTTIDLRIVVVTFRLYANVMVWSVVLSLATTVAYMFGMNPVAVVNLGGNDTNFYLGAYYSTGTPICMPTPVFRIQGLSEEPGTYAFALVPALLWLLLVEAAFFRTLIVVVGVIMCLSMGVEILLIIIFALMVFKKIETKRTVLSWLLFLIMAVGLLYVVSGRCMDNFASETLKVAPVAEEGESGKSVQRLPYTTSFDACKTAGVDVSDCVDDAKKIIGTSVTSKITSFEDRLIGSNKVMQYLMVHPLGSGAALGMHTINDSISVGFAVAVMEAGVIGGGFYIFLFIAIVFYACKVILVVNLFSNIGRIQFVVALSVLAVVFMGAQRIQPDMSFWHMWIYAMFFFFLRNKLV